MRFTGQQKALVINMKPLFIFFSSITVTILSIKRLLTADSLAEFFLGGLIVVVFGFFSLYLLFENKIKNGLIFKPIVAFSNKNSQTLHYSAILFALFAVEVCFLFFEPENVFIEKIRIIMIFFFGLSIVIILLNLIKLNRK